MREQMDQRYRQTVNAWCMYDWGSSAFSTTVEAAVLPVYFQQVVGARPVSNTATIYGGHANAVALLITAMLAPVVGSIADYTGGRKRLLAAFAGLGIVATTLMVCVGAGDWALALALFMLGSIGLGGSYVRYDALLPHIARSEDIGYVSSRGFAVSYLGGGILLAVNLLTIQTLLKANTWGSRLSFLTVAIWWAILTLPLLLRVPEPPVMANGIGGGAKPMKEGIRAADEENRALGLA